MGIKSDFFRSFLLIIEKNRLKSRTREESRQIKVDKMKKTLALSIVGIIVSVVAHADYYETRTGNCDMNTMRAELNRAVADKRAVITKIICEETIAEPVVIEEPKLVVEESCGEPFERVVNREYFVRETVQQYKPVVHYEPAGTYTTTRAICDDFGC